MAKPVQIALACSLSISLAPLIAEADRTPGGGGGGRLGQVSDGLGRATAGSVGMPSSGGHGGTWQPTGTGQGCHTSCRCETVAPIMYNGVELAEEEDPTGASQPRSVLVDFYAGAQKVYESDGSFSLELVFREGRFRIGGSFSRYYERQPGAEALTLTMPALTLGYRISDAGPTRAYVEAGALGVETANDPAMSTSIAGGLGGVRVEHEVSRRTTLVGDAQAMLFEEGVRAGAIRAGVQWGFLQATLRYLDFNVGPALFGPEVGVRF